MIGSRHYFSRLRRYLIPPTHPPALREGCRIVTGHMAAEQHGTRAQRLIQRTTSKILAPDPRAAHATTGATTIHEDRRILPPKPCPTRSPLLPASRHSSPAPPRGPPRPSLQLWEPSRQPWRQTQPLQASRAPFTLSFHRIIVIIRHSASPRHPAT